MNDDVRAKSRLCMEQQALVHWGGMSKTQVCEVHSTPTLAETVSVYTDTGLHTEDVRGFSLLSSQRA